MFAQVRDHVETPTVATAGALVVGNRYDPGSLSSPRRADRDWNRTFEMAPADVRGGALLVHGLTDSPYSMRTIAGLLSAKGFHALALRMPGHGTVPAGLIRAQGEDWLAAVRMGARHLRRTIGPDRPLILVGYSNGGAQVLRYALEAARDPTLPAPSRIVLISPMIGVTPAARLARMISALGPVPGFEKARWLDVVPEYNPFRYNSFPANAGLQSYRVSSSLQDEIAAAAADGAIERLPPILTFQSVVDSTVSTPAVVQKLYDRLRGPGHELVVFDINRLSGLEPFIHPSDAAMVARLAAGGARGYRRTLITNISAETLDVKARSVAPGSTDVDDAAPGTGVAADRLLAVAHRAAVSAQRSDLRPRAWGRSTALTDAGPAGSARREGRAHRANRDADAHRLEPVLRLHVAAHRDMGRGGPHAGARRRARSAVISRAARSPAPPVARRCPRFHGMIRNLCLPRPHPLHVSTGATRSSSTSN